ncbi:hypothetical protein EOE18_01005 [Novosphingobium umbonatum]|uniref:Uncharacterized protein n=1 Tax=Novosphingobium umbonatum TaxID=1908524 RepID=A0A437NCM3_9SPHN|nr:hypothetical protein [Novosphingobium umbonatum]RVU07695.1 hypothetical protein EOE18_01005 [Novosphingobium umbonatum]
MSESLLARIIRQNGHSLIEKAVDNLTTQEKAGGQQRLSLPRKLAGAALMKVATKSVPGAIVVGGVLLAKHLHDRKQAKTAATPPDDSEAGA